jgi:hypothetical protein
MRHYGPVWAQLLARWIGHRQPIIDRLLDPSISLTMAEREFLAGVIAGQFEWPKGTGKSVEVRLKQLRAAAVYLEFLNASGKPGKDDAAVKDAATQCKITERSVRRNIKFARALAGGKWWDDASRLARKRKLEALHRTY